MKCPFSVKATWLNIDNTPVTDSKCLGQWVKLKLETTGGAGNVVAKVLLAEVGKWLSDDDNPVNVKMYMELVLYGEIKADASLTHHTAAPNIFT